MSLEFTIPATPQPQERPMVLRRGWTIERPKSRAAKKVVQLHAQNALRKQESSILGPECTARLSVNLQFFGARRNADLDNLYKLITDAMQGVLYKNDSQIDHARIWRHGSEKENARTEVSVMTL